MLRGLRIDAISGKLIARDSDEKGLCGFQFQQNDPSAEWVVQHDREIAFFQCEVFVNQGNKFPKITPEKVVWNNPNIITIEFSEPVSGFVNILYYTNHHRDCNYPNSE